MSSQAQQPVIVVGAGIGGLTTALALLRRGIEVGSEQAPELGEIGAGVRISANGTRVLTPWG
jgi:salicylate hydroxylase